MNRGAPSSRLIRNVRALAVLGLALAGATLGLPRSAQAQDAAVEAGPPGLLSWLEQAASETERLLALSDAELGATGVTRLLRVYLDAYEPIENWYGPGAAHETPWLSAQVTRGETAFHAALRAQGPAALRGAIDALRRELRALRAEAERAAVPLVPGEVAWSAPATAVDASALRSAELRSIRAALAIAEREYADGRAQSALSRIEEVYLQQFEPMEVRLPGAVTRAIESQIHLRLRPMVARNASVADVRAAFNALYAGLADADAALAAGRSFWFGAANAFAIILREGLEAVLLIAAMIAYLTALGAAKRERARIYLGAGAGVVASFATWGMARTLLPMSGASREILEGVTALVAVAVLVYVSNWLFQKTYIHDWKNYLRGRVGHALTTGSALAMAGLAFAAVYREGFETVLFYQALLYDSSSPAVLAGFVPGLLIILGVGFAIIRAGVKLPLRRLFAVTNTILLYLALVFTGKGIYNLQEAGLFAPHPVRWAPDHEALRQLLGFYPLAETILAQLAFAVLMAGTYVYYRRRQTMNVPLPSPATRPEEAPPVTAGISPSA